MNYSDLKLELIEKIINTNNIDLLSKIKVLLDQNNYADSEENLSFLNEPVLEYKKSTSKNIRIFSEVEQKKINIALEQYKNGEYISNEEAQIELEEWFKEQEK